MSKAVARGYYQRFLALAEKWPVNPDLEHVRDPAVLLRKRIRAAFLDDNPPPIDIQSCERQYKALKDIVESRHQKDFASNRYYGALGLTYEELEYANSDEARKYLEERDELMDKLKQIAGLEKPKALLPPNLLLPEELKKLGPSERKTELIAEKKKNSDGTNES